MLKKGKQRGTSGRRRSVRAAGALLLSVLLLLTLSACLVPGSQEAWDTIKEKVGDTVEDADTKETETEAPDKGTKSQDSASKSADKTAGKTEAAAKPEPEPAKPSEAFADVFNDTLLNVVEKGEKLSSMQLDMLFGGEGETDNTRSNRTVVKAVISGTEMEGNSVLTYESLLDAKTGNASVVIGGGVEGETAQSGGAYFTGGNVLIRSSDTENKMIRHTLPSAQAESFREMSPIERLGRLFEEEGGTALQADGWDTQVDGYLETILSASQESDFVAGTGTIQFFGTDQNCETTTLTLKGENAKVAFLGLFDLAEQDSMASSVFGGTDESEEGGEPGGLEGIRTELDALGDTGSHELVYTAYAGPDDSAGLLITYTGGGKTCSFELFFYEKGHERYMLMNAVAFDGSMVSVSDENQSTGENTYYGYMSMSETTAEGLVSTEFYAESYSTYEDAYFMTETGFTLTQAATEDSSESTMDGSLSWTQDKKGDGVTGSGYLSLVSTSDGETTTYDADIELSQTYEGVEIKAPEFIESAGVSTSDVDGLLTAIDMDREQFDSMPASYRAMMVIGYLLS